MLLLRKILVFLLISVQLFKIFFQLFLLFRDIIIVLLTIVNIPHSLQYTQQSGNNSYPLVHIIFFNTETIKHRSL